MFQYTTCGRKIYFNFRILFLTPFCNQKRYFRVFYWFMHKSLPKNLKFKKLRERFLTKVQNVSIYNLGSKMFSNCQILYLTPFCNQKRYLRVFWPFYAHILTKKPKIQKSDENYVFWTQVQNVWIYILGSKNII